VNKRVLFLSASVGTGHLSAAYAIQEALRHSYPEVESDVIDVYRYSTALFGKMATKGYLQLIKVLPHVYHFFYQMKEKDSTISRLKTRFARITAQNLNPLVRNFSPHVFVCTHAFAAGVAALLKQEFGIPIVNVITDYTIHPFWVQPEADLYLVGNIQLLKDLLNFGIQPDQVKITGIPVNPKFCFSEKKREIKTKLGLNPDLKTILVMGGGIGLGPIGWVLRSLRKVNHHVQVIVIAGTNQKLKKRMERYAAKLNSKNGKRKMIQQVRVYGYTDDVPDLMRASDLLVTKPGGLTLSEALVTELPVLIVAPLPGPEVRNAQYFVKEKAAVLAKRLNQISGHVDSLLSCPQKIATLQEKARALKKPRAALDAAEWIVQVTPPSSNLSAI
jgi:processive 1,2-diacylglycerol beta-glucosyltransferase